MRHLALIPVFCFIAFSISQTLAGEGSSGGGNALVCFKTDQAKLAAEVRKMGFVPREFEYLDAIESIRLLDLQVAMHPEQPITSKPSFIEEPIASEPGTFSGPEFSSSTVENEALPIIPSQDGDSIYNYFRSVVGRTYRSYPGIAKYLEDSLADALIPNDEDKGKFEFHFTKNHIEYSQNVGWVDIRGLSNEDQKRCAISTLAYHHPVDKSGKKYRIVIDEVLYFHPAHAVQSRAGLLAHEFIYLKNPQPGKTAENAIRTVAILFRYAPEESIKDLFELTEGFSGDASYAYDFLNRISNIIYTEFYNRIKDDFELFIQIFDQDLHYFGIYGSGKHILGSLIEAAMNDARDGEWSIGAYRIRGDLIDSMPARYHENYRGKDIHETLKMWIATLDNAMPTIQEMAQKARDLQQKLDNIDGDMPYRYYDRRKAYLSAAAFEDVIHRHRTRLDQLEPAITQVDQVIDSAYADHFANLIDKSEFPEEHKKQIERLIRSKLEEFRIKLGDTMWYPRVDYRERSDFVGYNYARYLDYRIPACEPDKDCIDYPIPENYDDRFWIFREKINTPYERMYLTK